MPSVSPDAEAVEGKTAEATRLANQVRSASQSLTASYNIPSLQRQRESEDPEESKEASDRLNQLEQLRNQLLTTMADAGDKIGETLDMKGIRSEDLRALANGQSPDSSESSEDEDDGSAMLDHNTVAYRKVRKAIREQRKEAFADNENGAGGEGKGKFQPGLHHSVPNPEGKTNASAGLKARACVNSKSIHCRAKDESGGDDRRRHF